VKSQRRRVRLLAGGLLIAPAMWAAAPAVDAELLEFLGSVDSEERDWSDFLEHTDLDRIVRPAARPPAKDTAKPPLSAAKPPPKGTVQ
jgi:hypothetical protein